MPNSTKMDISSHWRKLAISSLKYLHKPSNFSSLRSKRYGGFGYYGGSGGGCDTCGGGYFGGYAPSNFYGGGCDMCGGGYRSYYGYFGWTYKNY